MSSVAELFLNALELGLITSVTVLALFLSYSMLNVCDLSTDGCFTLGAVVGATVAIAGHPFLAIPAAMAAGMLSGFVTAFLQTRLGIDSLLSGIVVNTGLYSVNIAIMKGASILNLNFKTGTDGKAQKIATVFTKARDLLADTVLAPFYRLAVIAVFVLLIVVFLSFFLKTRLGLAIRATGNNPDMVRSSSVNTVFTTTVGLCIANAFTGLSGCLLSQYGKSADVNIGSGILTISLASLLIGRAFLGKGSIPLRAAGAVLGAFVFRVIYAAALQLNVPTFMLKAVSSLIVIIAIAAPYLKSRFPLLKRKLALKKGQEGTGVA